MSKLILIASIMALVGCSTTVREYRSETYEPVPVVDTQPDSVIITR